MKAFNFFTIDCIRCKNQIAMATLILVVFTTFFGLNTNTLGIGSAYLLFMSVMCCGQPFGVESQSDSGFIDMIPGTRRERVIGRYLYALACLVAGGIMGGVLLGIQQARGGNLPDYSVNIAFGFVGVAFLIVGIQYICLYVVGKGKSQQFMAMIQVIPSLVLFFGAYFVSEIMEKYQLFDAAWAYSHRMMISSGVFVFGVIALAVSFIICDQITERRDYA